MHIIENLFNAQKKICFCLCYTHSVGSEIRCPKYRFSALSFEIDKLTRSIENAVTGDRHPILVLPLAAADVKRLKKKDWLFEPKREAADRRFTHDHKS